MLDLKKAPACDDLPDATASGAAAYVSPASLGSAARTGLTGYEALDFKLFLYAFGRLFEGDLEIVAEVRSAFATLAPRGSPATSAKNLLKNTPATPAATEHFAKEI